MSTVWAAPIAEAVSSLIVEHGGAPDRLVEALTSATEKAIKAGILAERERCAKVTEGFEDTTRNWVPGSLYDNLRREIAAAIRSPQPSPPTGA